MIWRKFNGDPIDLPIIEAVENAIKRGQDKAERPVRSYAPNLYPIAEAKRHSDLQERRENLRRTEASANAFPINPGGWQTPGRVSQQAQVSEIAAQAAEQIRWIESLADDDLVRHYLPEVIAQMDVPPVVELRNSDNSPIRRGGYAPSYVPGMNSASV